MAKPNYELTREDKSRMEKRRQEKLRETADVCARKCADHPNNATNPHVYARAHMMVLAGQLSYKDFHDTGFNPGDVHR